MQNDLSAATDQSDVAVPVISTEILLELQKNLLNTLDFDQLVQKIIDELPRRPEFKCLGYRIIVLALADKEKQILKRVSLSHTTEGEKVRTELPIQFTNIYIPFSATDNLCIKAYNSQSPEETNFWPDILTPPLLKEQAVQLQQSVGIKSSIVYPIIVKDESIGVLIFSLSRDKS